MRGRHVVLEFGKFDDRILEMAPVAGTTATATSPMTRVVWYSLNTTNSSDCTRSRDTRRKSVPLLRTFQWMDLTPLGEC